MKLLALVTLTCACSVGMKPVQTNRPPTLRPTCTKSATLPVLDAVGGLTLGVIGGLAIASSDSSCNSAGECPEIDLNKESKIVGGLALVGAAIYLISAIVGAEKKHDCDEAFRKFRLQASPQTTPEPAITAD